MNASATLASQSDWDACQSSILMWERIDHAIAVGASPEMIRARNLAWGAYHYAAADFRAAWSAYLSFGDMRRDPPPECSDARLCEAIRKHIPALPAL